MKKLSVLGVCALLLAPVACSNESTSPLTPKEQLTLDAKGDVAVTSDLLGDAGNPRSIQSDGAGT